MVKVLKSTPNLIGVEKVVGDELGAAVNPPPALRKSDRIAAADLVLDADAKVRRGLLSLETDQGEVRLSLAAKLALLYLQKEGMTLQEIDPDRRDYRLGKAVFVPFKSNDGSYVGADERGYQIILNYRGKPKNFYTVSMPEVLAGKLPPNWGRDRIILIGTTAASLNDFVFTPYDSTLTVFPERTPGIVFHANLVSQIISGALDGRAQIQVWSEPLELVWIGVWSLVGAILAWTLRSRQLFHRRISPQGTFGSIFLASSGLVLGAYVAFCQGYWIPLVTQVASYIKRYW
ncbi:adenylate cyclase [Microseira wollei NIES-4236]|uniref:Adenylate cyclase n=1 Tax=Microseira wollei NIES-4236 TaxID=2530354 RepID=A0AAV3XB45_9CYAN|nr:adenylate cyclase [Microseira wollei NIES-4236]